MELSVVIPFYNEEDNAAGVLNGIDAVLSGSNISYEIVAVDNGSIDKTGKILEELKKKINALKVVKVNVNEGYGWGIRQGLEKSRGDYLGFMCGDNQVDASEIIRVYDKLKKEGLDLCKVKRVERHDGFSRKFISFFYNIICPLLFSVNDHDLNGTPKIFKRSIFQGISLVSKGWFIDAEIMIRFSNLGSKIGDVSVVFKKREKGASKVNIKAVFGFIGEMLAYKIKH
ncbi:MAG: glycosyltransferase family 2 protein [Candidatus Omnitrophota bacterium]|nr:glycosyltransferase family 2 protein [Candidatus Omnitrophota bacterium]